MPFENLSGGPKPKRSKVSDFVSEYTENSNLHGIGFIGDHKRHWLERFIWCFAYIISLYFASTLIWESYRKWQTVPIVTSVDEFLSPISDIPPPAITFCSDAKNNVSTFDYFEKLKELEESPDNVSSEDQGRIATMLSVCKVPWNLNLKWSTLTNPKEYASLLKKMSFNFDVLNSCIAQDQDRPCNQIFTQILTTNGICYTYNMKESSMIYRDEVDDDLKYKPALFMPGEKRKLYNTTVEKAKFGRELTFLYTYARKLVELTCVGQSSGITLKLHSSDEIPNFMHDHFTLPMDQTTTVKLVPKVTRISKGLAEVAPKWRNCYFKTEKYLRYFKSYNQHNCELECWSNMTLKYCGCVKFTMPRNSQTKICGITERRCYDQAYELMLSVENNKTIEDRCNCMPNCNNIHYGNYLLQRFDVEEISKDRDADAYTTFNYAEPTFVATRRSELITQNELLASCGGLLGLFFGFSFLSLAELFYFFSIHIYCKLKREKSQEGVFDFDNNNKSDSNDNKCSTMASKEISEYSKITTLHGVKYIGDKTKHWVERLLWAIVFIISIYFCSVRIVGSYNQWQESLIITRPNEFSSLVSDIPFPAVTICADLKNNLTEFNWVEKYDLMRRFPLSDLDKGRILAMMSLCYLKGRKVEDMDKWKTTYQPDQYIPILTNITYPVDRIFSQCSFQGIDYPCDDKFWSHSVNLRGICYTFNGADPNDIFRDTTSSDLKPKKRSFEQKQNNPLLDSKGKSLGIGTGLKLTYTNLAEEFSNQCGGDTPGLFIYLHSPHLHPYSEDFSKVQLNNIVKISIKPKSMKISKGLEKLAPKQRNCFLENERYLRFFKVYTQTHCMYECQTNISMDYCGCVSFWMPRDDSMKVCRIGKMDCYEGAYDFMIATEFTTTGNLTRDRCNCLPTCFSTTYEAVLTENILSRDLIAKKLRSEDEYTIQLQISYDEPTFVAFTRSQLFDQLDFIANCGGILGLFVGFSFLSLIELIYFITLRFSCNFKSKRKNKIEDLGVRRKVEPYLY